MLRDGSRLKTPGKRSHTCSPRNAKGNGRKSGKSPKTRYMEESIEKLQHLAGPCLDFSDRDVPDNNVKIDQSFECHRDVSSRMAKTLYFANKLPSTPRPSLPLTAFAVKSYTEILGNTDTLYFLDLEMASEIGRNACVTPTALIMALIYLERLSTNNPSYITGVKPSELFVVSLLVASKFIQDDGEDSAIYNNEWAVSSNIPLKELNKLEIQFLVALNWNVNMKTKEFMDALDTVERKLALCQGLQRGWFTYTEIDTLFNLYFNWHLWGPILDSLVKLVTVASVTYTTLLVTILTSSFIGPRILGITQSLLLSSSSSYLAEIQPQCASNMSNSNSCHSFISQGIDQDQDIELPLEVNDDNDNAFLNRYYGRSSYSLAPNANSVRNSGSGSGSGFPLFNFQRIFEDLNTERTTHDTTFHHRKFESVKTNTNYTWGILRALDFAPPLKYPQPSRALKCDKLHVF